MILVSKNIILIKTKIYQTGTLRVLRPRTEDMIHPLR